MLLRILFIYIPIFFAIKSNAQESIFPDFYNAKELNSTPMSVGKNFDLNISVQIPPGQKLRNDSELNIYEMTDNAWVKTDTIPIQALFHSGGNIHLNKSVRLQSDKGTFAIGSTIYHCAKTGGYCVIDYYQGYVKRVPESQNTQLKIQLIASAP